MNRKDQLRETTQRKQVWLVSHNSYAVKSLIPIARALDKKNYQCKLFCKKQVGVEKDIPKELDGYPLYEFKGSSLWSLADKLHLPIKEHIAVNWRMRSHWHRELTFHSPAAVLVTEDRLFDIAWLVREANKLNIPTYLISWCLAMPQRYYDEMRTRTRELERNKGRSDDPPNSYQLVRKLLGIPYTFYRASRRRIFRWGRQRVLEMLGLSFHFPYTYGGGESRRFTVTGEALIEQFEHQGVSRDKMVVTGDPQYDDLYLRKLNAEPSATKSRICSEMGLPIGTLAVYTTQHHVKYGYLTADEHRRHTSIVIESVLNLNDSILIIKIHPKEELEEYAFVSRYGSRVAVCKDYNLIDLVEACDVFISQLSSTILLPIAWGKPVLSFNFTDVPAGNFFGELGGTLHVSDPDEFQNALLSLIKDEDVRKHLSIDQQRVTSQYMKFDGNITQRIVSLIERDIHSSRSE